ncbi:MAG: putative toxin-antitoxin system toxin component, PIN family [Reyranella sp.]|nr:putative toxin-antitoxin system toxin component, PIN family [Reyranella sp.]
MNDSIYAVIVVSIVLDTNVVIAALRSGSGAARQVLLGCAVGAYEPLFGPALLAEYEYALFHERLPESLANQSRRREILADVTAVGRWVNVYYLWRPNLRDEADNHLVELAVAGGAAAIVTHNVRDLVSGELMFPSVRVLTPGAFLKEFPCPP